MYIGIATRQCTYGEWQSELLTESLSTSTVQVEFFYVTRVVFQWKRMARVWILPSFSIVYWDYIISQLDKFIILRLSAIGCPLQILSMQPKGIFDIFLTKTKDSTRRNRNEYIKANVPLLVESINEVYWACNNYNEKHLTLVLYLKIRRYIEERLKHFY